MGEIRVPASVPYGASTQRVIHHFQIYEGELADHFRVDTFQTYSGTSKNMNVNEFIANRCSQCLGDELGLRVQFTQHQLDESLEPRKLQKYGN